MTDSLLLGILYVEIIGQNMWGEYKAGTGSVVSVDKLKLNNAFQRRSGASVIGIRILG